MSVYIDKVRARLNPEGRNLADVLVRGTGIRRGWLRRPRGAGTWGLLVSWLIGVMSIFGLIFLMYVLLVCLAAWRA
jgi:hypothetical protein